MRRIVIRKTLSETYKTYQIGIMALKTGLPYDNIYSFSKEELTSVTTKDIVIYIKMKVYGVVYLHEDQNPKNCLFNSIAFAKKKIQSFMPNKLIQWNKL